MGGYSQIATELVLLETACARGKYSYYHLLSGQDLPLKSQDDIYAFFEEESGYEFVRFYNENFEAGDRVYYYYPFQEVCGKGNGITTFPFKIANCFMVAVQKMIKFTRNKDIRFQKGSNWFSITDNLARYVLSKKQWIKKVFFCYLLCG